MGGSFAGSKILDVMKYNTDGDGLAVLGGWVFGISDSVERFVLPEGLKGRCVGDFQKPRFETRGASRQLRHEQRRVSARLQLDDVA